MAPDAKSDELLGEEHPLLLELASLHQAVAHYQVCELYVRLFITTSYC